MPHPGSIAEVAVPLPLRRTYTYLVPDDRDYVQPTFIADYDWLHVEARYNYEDFDTGSVWAGYNFGGGEKLEWEISPMLGGVFGDRRHRAKLQGLLAWWKLELSSEGEYVFDAARSSDSFFYMWSELSSPADWLRFGAVFSGPRSNDTEFDIQRFSSACRQRLDFTVTLSTRAGPSHPGAGSA
jgi:hypothetical protein